MVATLALWAWVVHGVVVAGNGLPVGGARVAACGVKGTSAADGSFTLDLPEGCRQLTAVAAGYAPATVANIATGSTSVRVVLQLAALAESVTVTATARNTGAAAVPLRTAVMGEARLRTTAASNVDSILRGFPDLGSFRENSSQTANPTTQGVALLGTGSSGASRALVLLDGIPLNDFYGGWVDWLRVPTEALSSVTVVAGGASPLYGNDALSGVIGLETRAPGATHVEMRSGGGGLVTAVADGSGDVIVGAWALAVRGRGVRVGGYVPAANPGVVDTNAGVAAQNWAPELRWLASPHSLFTLSSEYFGENRHNGTVLQVNQTRLRQIAGRGVVERDGVWDGRAFYQTENFDANFSALAADRNAERLTLEQHVPAQTAGAALNWSVARAGWSLVAGGSGVHIAADDVETAPPNLTRPARSENGRQRLGGGFVEGVWTARRNWTWTGTLRRDGWSNFAAFEATPGGVTPFPDRSESAWSPALGTVVALKDGLRLHASGYESFRAPTLNELYRPFRAGNVLTEANPLLAAERYRGAQAGAAWQARPGLILDGTYFDGTVSNLVTSVTLATTPTLITRQRQNLGRVRPRGETVSLKWQARPQLTLWAADSHLESKVVSAAQAGLIGLATPHVPRNSASFRALWVARGWSVSAVERFGGSNFDDDQNRLPLPAFWTTETWVSRGFDGGRWSPYVAVENLFNRRYAIELTPEADLNAPRAVTAGVRIRY